MKRLLLVFAAFAFMACEGGDDTKVVAPDAEEEVVDDSAENNQSEKSEVAEFESFLSAAKENLLTWDSYTATYTNGNVLDGDDIMGASFFAQMILYTDGTAHEFHALDTPTTAGWYYDENKWWVSEEEEKTIVLYNPRLENPGVNNFGEPWKANVQTKMELLSFKDGKFILKGIQPHIYSGSSDNKLEYLIVNGHIVSDPAKIERFKLSYKKYGEHTSVDNLYLMEVSGRVTDSSGKPIEGIYVGYNETGPLKRTNIDGEYSVRFVDNADFWSEGQTSKLTLIYNVCSSSNTYDIKTITYDFTDEHIIENPDYGKHFRRTVADVVL